jgi:hypothetical protein
VFIDEILADMTQVSDVAPGPLVDTPDKFLFVVVKRMNFLNRNISN